MKKLIVGCLIAGSWLARADVAYVEWNGGFLKTDADTLVWPGVRLDEISSFSADILGGYCGVTVTNRAGVVSKVASYAEGFWVRDESGGKTVQFQTWHDNCTKCALVLFKQTTEGVTARIIGAYYKSMFTYFGCDCVAVGSSGPIATSASAGGYGVCGLRGCRAGYNRVFMTTFCQRTMQRRYSPQAFGPNCWRTGAAYSGESIPIPKAASSVGISCRQTKRWGPVRSPCAAILTMRPRTVELRGRRCSR